MSETRLTLFPNLLSAEGESAWFDVMAPEVEKIDHLIAESPRGARAFLSHFKVRRDFSILSEKESELDALLEAGKEIGVISDAGLAAIADPAYLLVARARAKGLAVRALCGPSSITQALILSGFCGQRFSFEGYPPKSGPLLDSWIIARSEEVQRKKSIALWIERPYQNAALLKRLIEKLPSRAKLALCLDLSTQSEEVIILPIDKWREQRLAPYNDRPAIFILAP